MNIFEKDSVICGDYKKSVLKNSTFEVFKEIQSLHEILGEDAYLLDAYLVDVFERINSVDLTVTQHIAEGVMEKLNIICYKIIEGKAEENPQNEFCEKVKSFIENNPLPFKEPDTQTNLYTLIFIDEFINFSIPDILKKFKDEITNNLSSLELKEKFEKAIQKIGKDKIELLNDIIENRFIRVPLIDMFIQSISQQICTSMLQRDIQTSKQIFQILCDLKGKTNLIGGQHE